MWNFLGVRVWDFYDKGMGSNGNGGLWKRRKG